MVPSARILYEPHFVSKTHFFFFLLDLKMRRRIEIGRQAGREEEKTFFFFFWHYTEVLYVISR